MNTEPSPSLFERRSEAIETLYKAFAMPKPRMITGCPCCIETRGVDVLLTTPLRVLTGQMLWPYVSGVFYTIGDDTNFRYFLPRILEISVTDPNHANNPEIVIGKIGLSKRQAWSAVEIGAVDAFIDAWFDLAIAQDLAEAQAGEYWISLESESVLCGAARAGFPVSHWLRRLQEPMASPVLAAWKAQAPNLSSGFWEDVPAAARGEVEAMLGAAQAG